MKNLILSLSIVSLVSAKNFDNESFNKMNNQKKFNYCQDRYSLGLSAHNGKENHKKHPDFIKEQKICCSGIDSSMLSSDEKYIYDNEWDCTK